MFLKGELELPNFYLLFTNLLCSSSKSQLNNQRPKGQEKQSRSKEDQMIWDAKSKDLK